MRAWGSRYAHWSWSAATAASAEPATSWASATTRCRPTCAREASTWHPRPPSGRGPASPPARRRALTRSRRRGSLTCLVRAPSFLWPSDDNTTTTLQKTPLTSAPRHGATWSRLPAGRCRWSTPASPRSTWPCGRGRPVRRDAHGAGRTGRLRRAGGRSADDEQRRVEAEVGQASTRASRRRPAPSSTTCWCTASPPITSVRHQRRPTSQGRRLDHRTGRDVRRRLGRRHELALRVDRAAGAAARTCCSRSPTWT